MEVQINTMPINQHSKKRKNLFTAVPSSASCVSVCSSLCSPMTTPLSMAPPSPSSTTSSSSGNINLSTALMALKVSLKRDFESFAPPTPAVSPAHGCSVAKRTRFDFEELEASNAEGQRRVKAAAPPTTVNALLAVSNRIKFELDKRRRNEGERVHRPRRRKQLSCFAIVGAFQRAAHEREVAMQLECVVEASTK
ncbi:unnamed protein product [Peronospora destructor]|uniref:Uncharacterized protein n=1 Tax=Peronospora destructor TaxID=86335 RepID=A0AAV0VCZ9_9STRA|nr:unnamed protein product [Peronospora destructor]